MQSTDKTMQAGDVIQISPDSDVREEFKGKLAMVDEVKNWGIVAFVATFNGRAYIRLPWHQFEYVGQAPFVPEDVVPDAA